ncbi:MAG TPA: hypothetical protein VF981_16530 [Gemmatimonadaceae bacterium]
MIRCSRCIGGVMLGDSCLLCGWTPQEPSEWALHQQELAAEGQQRLKGAMLPKRVSKRRTWLVDARRQGVRL